MMFAIGTIILEGIVSKKLNAPYRSGGPDGIMLPTGASNPEDSALPFRRYALIWNEWYGDQGLQTVIDLTSGADNSTT